MDLKLHRPRGTCAHTGRPFAANETFYSALVRAEAGLERIDCAAEAWAGPPAGTLAWWQSRYSPKDAGGPTLAPPDVLLDVLEQLEDRPEDAALRYLIALELIRRRVLRIVERPAAKSAGSASEPLVLACRKRDRDYVVSTVTPGAATAGGVEERLQALLWSGGAA